jgi:hypothetical protein
MVARGQGYSVRTERNIVHLILASPAVTARDFPGQLPDLEDVESAVYLRGTEFNVFGEMHRIAQRQFHWQRGYFNLPQLYRYTYIYAQGKCGEFFQQKYGIPVTELSFVGFALFVQTMKAPWINRTVSFPELELTEELLKKALPLLLISADRAREETIHGAVEAAASLSSYLAVRAEALAIVLG